MSNYQYDPLSVGRHARALATWRSKTHDEQAVIMAHAAAPRSRPPAPSGDGRVRVMIASPCAYLGGAERVTLDQLRYCDRSKVEFVGICIAENDSIPEIPSVRKLWEEHAPVVVGLQEFMPMSLRADLLVAWGFASSTRTRLVRPGMPTVEISHCAWESNQNHCAMPGSTVVAVSRSALRGIPPERRDGARVILNAVHPGRVSPIVGWADQRARWGVPAGSKVVGIVSRLAKEKRPETWIDGVAALPPGWFGVWVGIGMNEPSVRAYANRVAPGRVAFPGATDDVGSALRAFDCFLMTSDAEGCCIAMGESWLAGCPVISTTVGMLEARPDLARLLPMSPTGPEIAAAILADTGDRVGTLSRVARGIAFATGELSTTAFGDAWTRVILDAARPQRDPLDHFALALDAELCPSGAGPCGCDGGPPRSCGHPGRPGLVMRPECVRCRTVAAWESGVDAVW